MSMPETTIFRSEELERIRLARVNRAISMLGKSVRFIDDGELHDTGKPLTVGAVNAHGSVAFVEYGGNAWVASSALEIIESHLTTQGGCIDSMPRAWPVLIP